MHFDPNSRFPQPNASCSSSDALAHSSSTHEGKSYKTAKLLLGRYPRFTSGILDQIRPPRMAKTEPFDAPDLEKPRVYSVIDSLDLPNDTAARKLAFCLSRGFTFKEYMDYALYDPRQGYYTVRPGVGTDFHTTPVDNSPFYGKALSHVIMKLWQGMVDAGTFRRDEPFDVCELGAGTGILARDIVQHIREMATADPAWDQLYRNLNYIIGEISPELRARQHETTALLQDKISIREMDARRLKATVPKDSINGIILSNELPDAFPSHKVRKTADGRIEAAVVFPVIGEFRHFTSSFPLCLDPETFGKFLRLIPLIQRENHALLSTLHPKNFELSSHSEGFGANDRYGILSKQTYKRLREIIGPALFDLRVEWKEFWVPAACVPDILPHLKTHDMFFKLMDKDKVMPLNTDLRAFQEGSGHALNKGFQLTIDYQYSLFELLEWGDAGFRVFPGTTLHDYSQPPGEEDITHDVSATALAEEGLRSGLEPFHFCKEVDLLGLSPEFSNSIALPDGGLAFYALLLKKKHTATAFSPPDLSLPVTYRELFLEKADWSKAAIVTKSSLKGKLTKSLLKSMYAFYKKSEWNADLPTREDLAARHIEFLNQIPVKFRGLRECVLLLFPKLFFGKNALFTLAKEHRSVTDFDYKKILSYFTTQRTSDKTDRLLVQMVRQLLHYYYTDPDRSRVIEQASTKNSE